ncbi:MAG: PIN domain-containing protein [Anaerolineae bacterium]|nr:PIN domain-containing protein [Anaerolineae bacterium]MCO5193140.1 PIN domain-containing protein [Anaerolineae bacterium]
MTPLPVFLDTGYMLALLNTRDKYHQAAVALAQTVPPPYITSEAILLEIGNALSRPPHRVLGVQALTELRESDQYRIVPIDSALISRGFDLFRTRPDKAWGLTDCISFVIMQELGLTHALTTDHHFEQAGFIKLLDTE